MLSTIQRFIRSESSGGLVLMAATSLAMMVANSPWAPGYQNMLALPLGGDVAGVHLPNSLLLWVNDGLMAIFFFLVGLELKREMVEGELAEPRRALLPAVAALGGMLMPALIYAASAGHDAVLMRGWAIPTATDIAFALGLLTMLGSRIPTGLKVFLVSLAIIDDIGAVLIIALFYSHGLSLPWLATAVGCLLGLALLNRQGVAHFLSYLFLALALWVAVLNSGVHATLAGVAAAFFIPLHGGRQRQPLKTIEEALSRPVAFLVLPVFAFCNAGIPVAGLSPGSLVEAAPLGIAMGLLLGKQVGVFGFTWLAVKLRLGQLPAGVGWRQIHAVAVLCGIGFTMSLFIAGLAFDGHGAHLNATSRLGILLGSCLSAIAGYVLLARQLPRRR